MRHIPLDEQDYGPWSPAGAVRRVRDYLGHTVGLKTGEDVSAARSSAMKAGFRSGVKAGPEQMSTGQASELAARKISATAGKKIGAAADYGSQVMSKGAKAFRQGMEHNPAAIGATAIGAGLGALGLSKLLRRRKEAPA